MAIHVSVHDATKMTAQSKSGVSWLKINSPLGEAVIFMPEDAAYATANAFNDAMAAQDAKP